MATPEKKSAGEQTTWVDRLVPDPSAPPQLLALWGFVGKGGDDEHVRLYWDASLRRHWEVPRAAIVHREPMEGGALLRGCEVLWLSQDCWKDVKAFYC